LNPDESDHPSLSEPVFPDFPDEPENSIQVDVQTHTEDENTF
jgi:hypothetical protein